MFSKTTLAYMAGILDGEGHFSIIWHKPHDRYHGIVGVMNTNLDLLEWIHNVFGGSIYRRITPTDKSHWKDRYEWRAGNKTLDFILPPIAPFLIIKKRHAEIMIEFRSTFGLVGGRGNLVTPTVYAKRKRLRENLLILNDSHRAFT